MPIIWSGSCWSWVPNSTTALGGNAKYLFLPWVGGQIEWMNVNSYPAGFLLCKQKSAVVVLGQGVLWLGRMAFSQLCRRETRNSFLFHKSVFLLDVFICFICVLYYIRMWWSIFVGLLLCSHLLIQFHKSSWVRCDLWEVWLLTSRELKTLQTITSPAKEPHES